MQKVFQVCQQCYGYGLVENYDNPEIEETCDFCYGELGDWIKVGNTGTMVTDVREGGHKFNKSQLALIKRKGSRIPNGPYPYYYHNDIKLIKILNDKELIVVIGRQVYL